MLSTQDYPWLKQSSLDIYITESLIDLTRIAGNGCNGHVHLSVESQAFEPVEASFRKLKKLLKSGESYHSRRRICECVLIKGQAFRKVLLQ